MSGLVGKRVVITRAPHQVREFEALLCARGALPLCYPCIDIAPPADPAPLDAALHGLATGTFDWLILTSANVVRTLANRLSALGLTARMHKTLRVAVVGPATAAAAKTLLDLQVEVMPETYLAQAIPASLPLLPGARLLLPQSSRADAALHEALMAAGAQVTVVEAYCTVIGQGGVDLPAILRIGRVDAITFTSPSTVTNLLQRLRQEGGDTSQLAQVIMACIGSKTAAAARTQGLKVTVTPVRHTLEGLIDVLEGFFNAAK